MFRIIFDPTVSKFVVQILTWGFFWRTCCDGTDKLYFDTYEDTCAWASRTGLCDAYEYQGEPRGLYVNTIAR